jgi:hypothetical protein
LVQGDRRLGREGDLNRAGFVGGSNS